MDALPSLEKLRNLIGQRCDFQGHACRVVEVLKDGPALVLECSEDNQTIQPNQFGDASRRVARTHTLPVFNEGEAGQLHPDFERLWSVLNTEKD